jgi:iron complex transport system ATP-binding protein
MLELRNVSCRYPEGARNAVFGVSLTASRGTVLSLLGPKRFRQVHPSPCGLGMDETRGRGSADRRDAPFRIFPRRAWSNDGLPVPDGARILHLRMPGVCADGTRPAPGPLEEPDETRRGTRVRGSRLAGHGDFARRHVTALSGGELQLVRIARCLTQEAPLILLDEPTAALDPANALRVADALRALADSGKRSFFSTHDAALASYVSGETALIREGRFWPRDLPRKFLPGSSLAEPSPCRSVTPGYLLRFVNKYAKKLSYICAKPLSLGRFSG